MIARMASRDMDHFVALRKELTGLRNEVENKRAPMEPWQRDLVAISQAEALADIAATLNDVVTVNVNE